MAENTSPLPLFSAAGYPADFFSVCKGISNESALAGASMFLATATSLGNTPEALNDDARWAIVCLVEMAKALVDTVVDSLIEARREAVQAVAEGGQ